MISLAKGGTLNLEKTSPGLTKAALRLSWDPATGSNQKDFDLDVSAILADSNNQHVAELGDNAVCFYNNLDVLDGAVHHMGDERTGESTGDDETVIVDFSKIPDSVSKVVVSATIHEADARGQNFGVVRNPKIFITNADTQQDLAMSDLAEDESTSTETSVTVGEFYRKDGTWNFRHLIVAYADFASLLRSFGFAV